MAASVVGNQHRILSIPPRAGFSVWLGALHLLFGFQRPQQLPHVEHLYNVRCAWEDSVAIYRFLAFYQLLRFGNYPQLSATRYINGN
ncbi:hypothetical protein ACRALDRAFT_1059835 [Sodiomyces alcalophilus JCM 7366]|uniref:uncharacterized protein n=1 Tax=Sodiomyces alcalophilus JCM 7366 TaxID=591952 RepID=UPI0039B68C39